MNVVKPPPAKQLNGKLIKALSLAIEKFVFGAEQEKPVRRLIEHLTHRQADAEFCIAYLSTLHKRGVNCEIFAKDYVYMR